VERGVLKVARAFDIKNVLRDILGSKVGSKLKSRVKRGILIFDPTLEPSISNEKERVDSLNELCGKRYMSGAR